MGGAQPSDARHYPLTACAAMQGVSTALGHYFMAIDPAHGYRLFRIEG
jgi:hypothetical protein